MKPIPMMALMFAALGLSACAAVDTATRNAAPFEAVPDGAAGIPGGYVAMAPAHLPPLDAMQGAASQSTAPALAEGAAMPVKIGTIRITVPQELRVSEANSYIPRGDIVWRGDPLGDRHAQVKAIFEDAMARGAAEVTGTVPADLEITVRRFHALTEKARYTTGGVHSIAFELALRDPSSGVLVLPPREVRADLAGYGGQKALEAEARGETQKVRITRHLAEVLQQELTRPEGYRNAHLGFIQLLNRAM